MNVRPTLAWAALAGLFLVLACAAPGSDAAQDDPENSDPTRGEVRLGSRRGWNAGLVIDNAPVGIWTVRALDVFGQYACPEVVGLDDLGRCHVLVSYSGKWTLNWTRLVVSGTIGSSAAASAPD
jgi:hypothetical protein